MCSAKVSTESCTSRVAECPGVCANILWDIKISAAIKPGVYLLNTMFCVLSLEEAGVVLR